MGTTHTVAYLIDHLAAQLAKQSDQVLQEQLGIGLSQFKILWMLETEPRTTQRDIASNLGQTEASISRQVKLMLADGLLHSLRNPQDHREHIMVVTPKGARLTAAGTQVLERYHRPTFAALSDKQQEHLRASLESLHRQVCPAEHVVPYSSKAQ